MGPGLVGRVVVLAALLLAGCFRESGPPVDPPIDHSIASGWAPTELVVSHLELPTQPTQNDELGFDLDGDSHHAIDNKLGAVLQLAIDNLDPTWDAQAIVDAQVAAGQSPLLVELRANPHDRNAVLRVMLGRDPDGDPSNNFGGKGSFTVEPSNPADDWLYGTFVNGIFGSREPAEALVEMALTSQGTPLRFRLLATQAMIYADPAHPGLYHGKLGGGIPRDDVRDTIVPAIGKRIHDYSVTYPTTSASAKLRLAFDRDMDGEVSAQEFASSNLVMTVLSSDVDLVHDDALPAMVLGKDGKKECLSAGFGFDAVPATF